MASNVPPNTQTDTQNPPPYSYDQDAPPLYTPMPAAPGKLP